MDLWDILRLGLTTSKKNIFLRVGSHCYVTPHVIVHSCNFICSRRGMTFDFLHAMKKTCLRVSFDCGGIALGHFALKRLGLKRVGLTHRVQDVTEPDARCVEVLQRMVRPAQILPDVTRKCGKATLCDILIVTAPCQDWSSNGRKKGAARQRGRLARWSVRWVSRLKREDRPRLVVWENVKLWMGKETDRITTRLKRVGYSSSFQHVQS